MPAFFVKVITINKPPFGGISNVTPENGTALNTKFTISLEEFKGTIIY